ncbi:MAG: NAD-dependent epimerase/dehydratase family protein, partial [Actinobacteria bacterium]|nr:NAD-dependent epimerase/dehydratase family protein [Actinomycetota bacterium]
LDVNATGTARIFEVIRNGGLDIRKVVLASSQAIFGEGPYRRDDGSTFHPPLRPLAQLDAGEWEVRDPATGAALDPLRAGEELSPDGITPYALSKYFEERAGLALGRSLGIPVVALRYAVTYGPRQSVHNPYTGVISIFASRLLNGMPPVVFEDGRQTRDFIFVEDVARANLHVMDSDEIGDDVLNVGTGVPTRMLDLAQEIASVLGLDLEPHLPGEYRPGDVRHFVHDPAKLNRLGFVAVHSVRDGLARFAEWVTAQGPIEERFSAAATRLRATGVIRPAGAPSGG